jgi:hypothetical protein
MSDATTTVESTAPAPEAAATAPAAEAPAPAAMPNLGDSYTGIPQQFASDPDFKDFKSVNDVFSEYKTIKQVQTGLESNGLIAKLGAEATPEERHQFFEQLGKPKSAAEYSITAPEGLPQGLDWSDEQAAQFASVAFENDLLPYQVEALMKFDTERQKAFADSLAQQTQTAMEAKVNNNLAELSQIWGGAPDTDAFKSKFQLAERAFSYVADAKLAEAFKSEANRDIASNPVVMELLSRLGAKMTPDTAPGSGQLLPPGTFMNSVEAINQAKDQFKADGKFARMLDNSVSVKEREQLKAEWSALFQKEHEMMMGGH